VKVAMVRIGIDTGSGGIHGPLFADGTFDYLPIPDNLNQDSRTYGNMAGRHGRNLIDYFRESRRAKMADQPVHVDPEFETFTYGDPTPPKAGLRWLEAGDMLIFYCGLEGWGGFVAPPALYLMGYFEVIAAGRAATFSPNERQSLFAANYHVKHPEIYEDQKDRLVLVKGSDKSRLLAKAHCLSVMGRDRRGRPLKVISPEMQQIFGDFDGKISFQRSPTRWVKPKYAAKAAAFMRSL
jgi:hypothetical protein